MQIKKDRQTQQILAEFSPQKLMRKSWMLFIRVTLLQKLLPWCICLQSLILLVTNLISVVSNSYGFWLFMLPRLLHNAKYQNIEATTRHELRAPSSDRDIVSVRQTAGDFIGSRWLTCMCVRLSQKYIVVDLYHKSWPIHTWSWIIHWCVCVCVCVCVYVCAVTIFSIV